MTNKLRITYLKQCFKLSPFIRVQDLEDTIYNKKHQLLKGIFEKKQHYKLLKHNKLLIYPVENDTLTEFRIDLDNKILNKNFETMLFIKKKLESFGIKAVYEFTGSKGCHIRFLIDITSLNLNYKYSSVNLNDFETEFRNSLKSGENYTIIHKIAKQRLELKKQIARYLELYKLISSNDFDTNLLSSFYLLGCVGSIHRKTNNPKLDLNLNLLNSVDKINNYISNTKVSHINFNFFKDVWTIPADFKYKQLKVKPIRTNNNNKTYNNTLIKESQHTNESLVLNTLKELYINSQCDSLNRFSFYIVGVCFSFGFTIEEIKSLFIKIFSKINNNFDLSLTSDNNINSIYDFVNKHYDMSQMTYKFKDFWTHNQFLELLIRKGGLK